MTVEAVTDHLRMEEDMETDLEKAPQDQTGLGTPDTMSTIINIETGLERHMTSLETRGSDSRQKEIERDMTEAGMGMEDTKMISTEAGLETETERTLAKIIGVIEKDSPLQARGGSKRREVRAEKGQSRGKRAEKDMTIPGMIEMRLATDINLRSIIGQGILTTVKRKTELPCQRAMM